MSRDLFVQRTAVGDSPNDAVAAVVQAAITAERAACIEVITSWSAHIEHYGSSERTIRQIIDELKEIRAHRNTESTLS